jgi:hypothetical protein
MHDRHRIFQATIRAVLDGPLTPRAFAGIKIADQKRWPLSHTIGDGKADWWKQRAAGVIRAFLWY